ncbi:MAG: hypothetical protein Dbin4_02588, partial [Alphaproteobacteria bacterium]|nr:hypothetical protein [Alphaproteobacteria bacterium]
MQRRLLIEISSGYEASLVRAMLETALAGASDAGLLKDAVIAENLGQA